VHVKKPGGRHKRFRLFDEGKTVVSDELTLINEEYLAGKLSSEKAYQAVQQLRQKLTKPKAISYLPENKEIVREYFKTVTENKGLKSPKAALDRLLWGIKKIGRLYLIEASEAEFLRAIEGDNNEKRRAIAVINALLRFKNRNLVLQAPKSRKLKVDYLSLEEFIQVLSAIPKKEDKLYCQAAFGTGARYGEVFAMQSGNFRENGTHIWISEQRYRNWSLAPTKNDKVGAAFIIREFRTAVKEWMLVPFEVKQKMRANGDPYEAFKKACITELKRDLTLHNLRHSYARYMLDRGAQLTDLVTWMRDRMSTIEYYYLDWVQTSEQMKENIRKYD
jgi:integrase